MKRLLGNIKSKKVMTATLIVIMLIGIILTAYAATASGTIPGAVEITFNDENLYEAVKENLGDSILKAEDKTITIMQETIDKTEGLNLEGREISDISGLENFTSTTMFELQNNNISDISNLRDNSTIQVLNLNNNKLDSFDIQVIKTMPSLKRLGIGENSINSIQELKDLETLPNLVELTIADSNLTSLEGIEKFSNLEELYIGKNKITDFSKLAELPNLKKLDISESELNNIDIIPSLTKLEQLEVYNNNLEDISSLTNNGTIKVLNLNGNNLNDNDIEVLKTMTSLEELGISNNEQINKVSQLTSLTNLKGLTLSNSKIKDVNGIEALTNLESLEMDDNKIENIESICKLSKLKELSLINNSITDISPISNLTNITDLDLSLNNIAQVPNMDKISNIENVRLDGQLLNVQVFGETGDEKIVDIPQIFKDAIDSNNSEIYGQVLDIGGDLDKENKTFKADIFTVAREKGMGLEINGGILDGSKFVVNGTSIEYLQDLTNDFKDILNLDINADGITNQNDAEILKQYYMDEGEITEEQQEKITKLDLNKDGDIDDEDYNMLKDYITGNSNVLVTVPIYGKVNTDIIAKVITTDDNLEINQQKTITENGEYTFNYVDSDGKNQTLLANVDFIDKVAPEYGEPIYSTKDDTTGSVTVTITANEDLSDIYTPPAEDSEENTDENSEENAEEDNEENTIDSDSNDDSEDEVKIIDIYPEYDNDDGEWEDTGWRLAEDKRTISKTFTQNTSEPENVIMLDEAGNNSTIEVNVQNILQSNDEVKETKLIMKKGNSEGEEYISGVWTNQYIYVDIENKEDAQSVQYIVDGEDTFTGATTISGEGEHEIVLEIKDGFGNSYKQTYYVKIDKTMPEVGSIELKENNNNGEILENNCTTKENVYIHLEKDQFGQDEKSGHYKTIYKINGGEERSASSIIRESGNYEVVVTTYDLAGNSASQTYNFTINR